MIQIIITGHIIRYTILGHFQDIGYNDDHYCYDKASRCELYTNTKHNFYSHKWTRKGYCYNKLIN